MATLQNPNPNPPYPNRTPFPNSNPNPNSHPIPVSDAKVPSFDEISKFFSLPLSDAADSLGVCTSALRKVCYENGLVRWPHRKFLSGKSIEEIKKDAAIEKSKQLTEMPKVAGERNDALSRSLVSSSLGSHLQNKSSGAQQEMSKFRIATQHPGTKDAQIENSQNIFSANAIKGNLDSLDEFKYGFPSDGLSSAHNRWWGSTSADCSGVENRKDDNEDAQEGKKPLKDSTDDAEDLSSTDRETSESKTNEHGQKDDNKDAQEGKKQLKDSMDDAADLSSTDREMSESKTSELGQKDHNEDAQEGKQQLKDSMDETVDLPSTEREMLERKTKEPDMHTRWTSLLCTVRKKAVKEGKQALKLGAYRGHANKLDQTKKMVLLQIFKNSLPDEWKDLSL